MAYINDNEVLFSPNVTIIEGGSGGVVDQTFRPNSENAQSGIALAPIFKEKIGYWQTDKQYNVGDMVICGRDGETALYTCLKKHISDSGFMSALSDECWELTEQFKVFSCVQADSSTKAETDTNGNKIDEYYATKEEVGNIEIILDNIIATQNTLIGGDSE